MILNFHLHNYLDIPLLRGDEQTLEYLDAGDSVVTIAPDAFEAAIRERVAFVQGLTAEV